VRAPLLPAVVLLALAAMPPGAPLPGPAPAQALHVHIVDFAFAPDPASILAGEQVTWHNHDPLPHDATADDATWLTGTLAEGESRTLAFAAAATHPYHCGLHHSMRGELRVNAPGALPDLAVVAIGAEHPVPGVLAMVNATVRNLGRAEAPASQVAATYRYQGQEHPLGEAALPALGPGARANATIPWLVAGKVGTFRVTALADALGTVEEADEGNNAGHGTIPLLVEGLPPTDLLDPL
jgi:plastocyanin